MTLWLLEQQFALDFERSRARCIPTGDQMIAFDRVTSAAADRSIARVAGSVCEIPVVGVLTKSRDRLAWILGMGNTTYSDIRNALAQAESDPSIKSIVLRVDSPGGMVDGLFEAIDAIAACTKPVVAVCDLAASAAYGLASAAKRIEASNRASSFGSVGVAMSFSFWNAETIIDLTNTDSPDKRPDVRTEAGKAVVRKELDAIAALFMDAIARGRGTTAAAVKSGFGRGAMLLASAAKQAGMIDSVRGGSAASRSQSSGALDRGDRLVALMDGKRSEPVVGASEEPDLGDQIMAAYEQRFGRITPAKPASGDRGDRLVALMDGDPIESDRVAGGPQERDLGDQIMDAYHQRFGRSSAKHAPEASATPAPATPPNFDVGDQICEQLNAQREKREPAAWATTPIANPSARPVSPDVVGVPAPGQALAYARNTLIPLMRGESPRPLDEGDEADRLMASFDRVDARVRARRAAMR